MDGLKPWLMVPGKADWSFSNVLILYSVMSNIKCHSDLTGISVEWDSRRGGNDNSNNPIQKVEKTIRRNSG